MLGLAISSAGNFPIYRLGRSEGMISQIVEIGSNSAPYGFVWLYCGVSLGGQGSGVLIRAETVVCAVRGAMRSQESEARSQRKPEVRITLHVRNPSPESRIMYSVSSVVACVSNI